MRPKRHNDIPLPTLILGAILIPLLIYTLYLIISHLIAYSQEQSRLNQRNYLTQIHHQIINAIDTYQHHPNLPNLHRRNSQPCDETADQGLKQQFFQAASTQKDKMGDFTSLWSLYQNACSKMVQYQTDTFNCDPESMQMCDLRNGAFP